MRQKTNIFILICIMGYIVTIFSGSIILGTDRQKIENPISIDSASATRMVYIPVQYISIEEPSPIVMEQPVIITEEVKIEVETLSIYEESTSKEDVELLALLTMAEAEGESDEGKRLVIDTVLNRVDSKYFPDTIRDVIYQKDHFSSMWNGRVDRCTVTEETIQLVKEELEFRTDTDVIYFNSKQYSKYGVPMFKVENHYFSKYE